MTVSLSAEVVVLRRFSGKFVLGEHSLVSNGATKVIHGRDDGAGQRRSGKAVGKRSGVVHSRRHYSIGFWRFGDSIMTEEGYGM